ncbi:MAG TPA: hypothetical protein VN456_01300, partial [Desulfosporosinus sp.]|nr:hypothetical protein [Desulfosporosinus sp.]
FKLYTFWKVPSRHPWLQGHSAIHGQRISATKAAASGLFSPSLASETLDHPWSSPAADRMTNTFEDSVFGCQPSFLYTYTESISF